MVGKEGQVLGLPRIDYFGAVDIRDWGRSVLRERFADRAVYQQSFRLSRDVSDVVERIAVQSGVARNVIVSALLRMALEQCGHI